MKLSLVKVILNPQATHKAKVRGSVLLRSVVATLCHPMWLFAACLQARQQHASGWKTPAGPVLPAVWVPGPTQ